MNRFLKQSIKIFDVLDQAVLSWHMNDTGIPGVFTSINNAALELLGYSREEFSHLTPESVFTSESLAEISQNIQKYQQPNDTVIAIDLLRKDNTTVPVSVNLGCLPADGEQILVALIKNIEPRNDSELKKLFSDKNFKQLFDANADGVAVFNMQGVCILANDAYARMLGYTREEIPGIKYIDITPPQWAAYEQRIVEEQIIGRGYSDVYEKEYIRKDGTVFPVSIRANLIRDDYGNPIGMWGLVRDITEQKQLEQTVREQEIRLRTIQEQMEVGYWTTDTETLITSLFPARTSPYRGREKEFIGKPYGYALGNEDPEFPPVKAHWEALKGKSTSFQLDIAGEVREFTLEPLKNDRGEIIGVAGMVVPVTEERRLRLELQKAKDELELVNAQIPAAISIIDKDLRILKVFGSTTSSRFERKKPKIQGMTIYEYFETEDPGFEPIQVYKNALQGVPGSFELSVDSQDFSYHVSPRRDTEGNVTGILTVITDITKLKQTERALRAVNKELDDFAYMVSHDLKSPLNIMHGYATLIVENPESCEELARLIAAQIEKLAGIIDSILRLSRAGRVISNKTDVDLDRLIREVCLASAAGEAEVSCRQTNSLPVIKGDAERINMLFSNLISNAIQNRDPGKDKLAIEIGYRESAREFTIWVKDNGTGIEQKNLDTIFSPGFTKRKNKGTGFGLAISRKIVEAHGGRIWAESDGPGRGATFFMTFPR